MESKDIIIIIVIFLIIYSLLKITKKRHHKKPIIMMNPQNNQVHYPVYKPKCGFNLNKIPIKQNIIPIPVTQEYQMESINSNMVHNHHGEFDDSNNYNAYVENNEPVDYPAGTPDWKPTETEASPNYELSKTFNYDKKFADEFEHIDNEPLYMEF